MRRLIYSSVFSWGVCVCGGGGGGLFFGRAQQNGSKYPVPKESGAANKKNSSINGRGEKDDVGAKYKELESIESCKLVLDYFKKRGISPKTLNAAGVKGLRMNSSTPGPADTIAFVYYNKVKFRALNGYDT